MPWLRRLSSLVLKKAKGPAFEKRSELSVVLTGDSEVRRLNRVYRKKNKTTKNIKKTLRAATR